MILKTQTVLWLGSIYIAAFLLEDTTYEWYLGVIEDLYPNNIVVVSYLIWADTKGKTWVFHEDAQLVETETEQILMWKIHVTYMWLVRIKCKFNNGFNISKLDIAIE